MNVHHLASKNKSEAALRLIRDLTHAQIGLCVAAQVILDKSEVLSGTTDRAALDGIIRALAELSERLDEGASVELVEE